MRECNRSLEAASMELARRLAGKLFAGRHDKEEKAADAVSVAWEFSQNAPADATPESVSRFAIRRVKSNSQFGRSSRSIDSRVSRKGQRRPPRENGFDLNDFAGKKDDPAEIVALRLDVEVWWLGLRKRERRIARDLAMGHRTKDTAARFHVTPARISEIRKELWLSWEALQS